MSGNGASDEAMLFDTDILVWALRGNPKAIRLIDRTGDLHLSVVSYLELLQGARNRAELQAIKSYLKDLDFQMVPLEENIGHRAAIYMEQYALQTDLCPADALIAATATENALPLATGNKKHFSIVSELEIVQFRPG